MAGVRTVESCLPSQSLTIFHGCWNWTLTARKTSGESKLPRQTGASDRKAPAPSFSADWSVLTIFVHRQLRKYGRASRNHCVQRTKLKTFKSVAVTLNNPHSSSP